MKKIIIFNTSYGTLNMGDFIINNSIKKEMDFILKKNFIINYPTHTPVCHSYQTCNFSNIIKICNNVDYKFIAGTNIIKKNMLRPWPDWNVNIFNYKPYKNSILIGVGMDDKGEKNNLYTKILYKKILSREYIHSTRDEKTKKFLEKNGFKAINTGCATLWGLTNDVCKKIKKEKSSNVIFTLTDYCKDPKNDQKIINTLIKNYKEIYYWVQSSGDYDYLQTFDNIDKIKILYSLEDYTKILLNNKDIDYVGTRLHAGIYAMQHGIRSIIISIDNRTRDMKESYNLITIERNMLKNLDDLINSNFETKININTDKIQKWKSQFN